MMRWGVPQSMRRACLHGQLPRSTLGSADPGVPAEILRLKCFEMLSECFVQVAQRVENGSDPGPQFGIFVREHCVVTLTVQHCQSSAVSNLRLKQMCNAAITGRLNLRPFSQLTGVTDLLDTLAGPHDDVQRP